jgi:hypothetical protein
MAKGRSALSGERGFRSDAQFPSERNAGSLQPSRQWARNCSCARPFAIKPLRDLGAFDTDIGKQSIAQGF